MNTKTTTRCRYLYLCPRGFCNEFSIYRVEPGTLKDGRDIMTLAQDWAERMGADWITRREAERLTARERSKARDNLRAGLNLNQNPVGATVILDWWMDSGQTYWMDNEEGCRG